MSCAWIDRDDVFEGYVREALGANERDAFEEHVLGCQVCADMLETYHLLRLEIASTTPGETMAPALNPSRPWWQVPLAAAAGLLLIAALAMWLQSSSTRAPDSTVATAPASQAPAVAVPSPAMTPVPPATSTPAPSRAAPPAPVVPVAVLARVEPPIYLPLSLRGPRDDAAERFEAAMRRYVDKDYAGAIPDLRAATALNPKAAHATFFLAICQLLTGDIESSATGLQSTIALGDSPYLEEAHFYLAKARLRQGNLVAARDELTRVIERRGRLETDARQLLAQVNAHRLP